MNRGRVSTYQLDVKEQVTVTFRVSPLSTPRDVPKSPPPKSVPLVPDFVLLSAMKHPTTVAEALMLKAAFDAELSTDPLAIEPGVQVGLFAFEYRSEEHTSELQSHS